MILDLMLQLRLVLFIIGVALFFVTQRYLGAEAYFNYVLIGSSVLVVVATILPLLASMRSKTKNLPQEAKSWLYVFGWQLMVTGGLGTYVAYDKIVGTSSTPDTFAGKALLALWLLLLNFGFFSGIGVELAHRASGKGQTAEPRRVARAGASWFMVGMVLTFLVCFNFVAVKKDKSFDWSYLKATTPGEATIKMIKASSTPLTVVIFYPKDNDVRPFVTEYFDFIKNAAPDTKVEVYDKDLQPTKAEDYKVSRNGQVIMTFGVDKQERLDVGLELREARSMLKKLDAEVQKNFLRLSAERKTIYFTRGHGEASWLGDSTPLKSIGLIEKFLRSQNYSLKFFGLAEGSGTEVPDDAACVVIVGSETPFMKEEVESLSNYLKRGGSLLVFMDIDKAGAASAKISEAADDPLLKLLADAGIKYTKKPMANDRNYVSATRSAADKWFIFSNSFSSHESVASLAKHDEKIALLMYQAGFFDVEPKAGDWKSFVTVRSLPDTFVDENRNFAFDQGKENRKAYTLGAAAVLEIPQVTPKPEAGPATADAKDKKEEKPKEGKLIALADSTMVSDAVIRNPANALFLTDAIKWLTGNDSISGETTSEEDIKIQHSRKEDVLWFNGTVWGVPMLILAIGLIATRQKRRGKRTS